MSATMHPGGTFDLTGPLPTGTTVLEASAGTGKTYTIAALAARLIADGVALDEMMVVTFSRAATGELRSRIRDRLVSAEAALRQASTASRRGPGTDRLLDPDPVTALLLAGDPAALALRHQRLAAALAEFDEATIATTHEFCAQMLQGLGMLSRADPQRRLVDSLTELSHQVADDLYLAQFADQAAPALPWDTARLLAQEAVRSADLPLVPPPGEDGDPLASIRVDFAARVRRILADRKVGMHLFTHDDILVSLRASLTDPVHGPAAVARLRDRYRVVLVDEFQDTDPVQWDIVRTAFAGHATLILIGDPKQAIYAFRGADVQSYLDAVETGTRQTLGTNWRSDGPLVEAVDRLFAGTALGQTQIVLHPVRAHHATSRIHDAAGRPLPPVRLRHLPYRRAQDRLTAVGQLRPAIRQDVVAEVTDLLTSGTTLIQEGRQRPVEPGDIAVLVTRNHTAEQIRAALTEAGVPAVSAGASSVLSTQIAEDWLTLLDACENPRQIPVRRAALTPFLGWTLSELASAGDDQLAHLHQRIRRWARAFTEDGVSSALELIMESEELPARLLGRTDGERLLTDLRHIGQLLHQQMVTRHLGLPALAQWLAEAIADPSRAGEDEQNLRLETDSAAVQVLTVHRAKGLEFGIVLLPDAWDRHVGDDAGQVLRFHPAEGGDRVLDVGGLSAPGRRQRRQTERAEEGGESLRLLYVALTRARHQVVAWWAPSANTPHSALHRLLFRPQDGAPVPPERIEVIEDPSTIPGLDATLIRTELIVDRDPDRWRPGTQHPPALRVARFDRTIDTAWRRTSYTALTRAAHDHQHAVAVDSDGVREDDEIGSTDPGGPAGDSPAGDGHAGAGRPTSSGKDLDSAVAEIPGRGMPSPMAALPAGAEFGTIMHVIFEHTDPTAGDLAAEITAMTVQSLARTPFPVGVDDLAAALLPAFATPLGPLAGQRTLADIGPSDRLAELDFELPLGGGDRPRGHVTVHDVATLLRHHLPADSPLADYPAMLGDDLVGPQVLRGFLTGSIDSVLRIDDGSGPRHLVVDYKSNRLGDFETDLTVADYHPRALAMAMMQAHYPLQALLYSVALHRYLRWRMPDYDPARHLGGILYLFVRGMAGPATPVLDDVPFGVFSWHPSAELISELSDLLDRGPR